MKKKRKKERWWTNPKERGKHWEIVFRIEQETKDKKYLDRVENYEKILQLVDILRSTLIIKGIPIGFRIVGNRSGIREEGSNLVVK